ncbi:MAG TPA: phosphoadenylyl-sulfate reductase [Vicinamibacteria bacterium]|nr:phosphoadenylyl-sulfate reductase [Vicinamibacteria bacterium]
MELLQTTRDTDRQVKVRETTETLRLAAERFAPRLVMATGFGMEGCVLTDLIGRNKLPVDIFTLDTGLFFEETYTLWKTLERRYDLTIRAVRPELTVGEQAERFGDALWERDPDRCCEMRKVQPLRAALAGADAWITALRRDQTPDRANASMLEHDQKFGLVKINPLVEWTAQDVRDYVREHDVPFNPLHEQGYPSIGCAPCTSPVQAGESPRAGRWRGKGKTECGIHNRSSQIVLLPVLQPTGS